jgi:hypothetical protein
MARVRVISGRLYAANSTGLIARTDELALIEQGDGIVIAISGEDPNGEPTAIQMNAEGRLRVDTKPTDETVNLFAAPSPWAGNPWSSKSPW